MSEDTTVARINALTTNARNTWFVLLGALIFVGITLMSVEHIDFYGVDRATTLPVVNFDVPTRYFFVAAPILIAAIYGYFHLYLIRLWDSLGSAEDKVKDVRLGDAVTPWLVTDAALALRLWRRQDASTTHRTLEFGAMALNILLAWAFGILILAFLWWLSMPARTGWMTAVAGVALLVSAFTGYVSLRLLWTRMGPRDTWPDRHVTSEVGYMLGVIVLVPGILIVGHSRTVEPSDWIALAPIEIIDEAIVERPAGWLPHDIARKDFLATWCKRDSAPCKRDALDETQRAAFDAEWATRRATTLTDMRRPDWHKADRDKPDLRNAILRLTFLAGANLGKAQMQGADFRLAQLEGADLSEAQMQGADFRLAQLEGADLSEAQMKGVILLRAQMEGADLSEAQLQGADLRGAQMEGADLSEAQMQGAKLFRAQMEGANLFEAQMQGANLRRAQMERAQLFEAQMQEADLRGAQMEGAILFGAQMEGAKLFGAQMQGADLSLSHLVGLTDTPIRAADTNLSAATNGAGALRFVDLSEADWDDETDFRTVFLDGSVAVPAAFRARMGDPCQWVDAELTDAEFYALWRWWIGETGPSVFFAFSPADYLDVPEATPALLAKHGLTDCKPGQDFGPMPTD